MIDSLLAKALNDQMDLEFLSARIYLALAGYLDLVNLSGFSSEMKAHAGEEESHAMKIYEYLLDRQVPVVLGALEAVEGVPESFVDVFLAAWNHEKRVTQSIKDLHTMADALDEQTEVFLQWFLMEQVEEERDAEHDYSVALAASQTPGLIYLLDKEEK